MNRYIKTIIFAIVLNELKKKKKIDSDQYSIIRHSIPFFIRLRHSGKLLNDYYDFIDKKYIIDELIIYIYETVFLLSRKKKKYDITLHHIFSIASIFLNLYTSGIKKNDFGYKFANINHGINILNVHNIGDLSVRIAKVIYKYNSNAGYISGATSLLLWTYSRNILQYKISKKLTLGFKDDKCLDKELQKYTKVMTFFSKSCYLMGLFFTFKVYKFYYEKLKINKN